LSSTGAVDLASRRNCTLSSILVLLYSFLFVDFPFFFLLSLQQPFFHSHFSFPCHGAFLLVVTRSLIGVVPEAIGRLTARYPKAAFDSLHSPIELETTLSSTIIPQHNYTAILLSSHLENPTPVPTSWTADVVSHPKRIIGTQHGPEIERHTGRAAAKPRQTLAQSLA
jgi:hypothetical protein